MVLKLTDLLLTGEYAICNNKFWVLFDLVCRMGTVRRRRGSQINFDYKFCRNLQFDISSVIDIS